jgi:hypothetical protein
MALTANVLLEVLDERRRQDRLKAEGRFDWTCADQGPSIAEKYVVLAREGVDEVVKALGRVARAVKVSGDRRAELAAAHLELRAELIQTAAVAVAWVEGLDAAVGVVSESTQLNR